MDTTTLVLSAIIALLLAGFLGFIFWIQRKQSKEEINITPSTTNNALQLQAYERLVLLVDRIALPNLIARLNQPNLSAKEMRILLIQSIKQEFDYNITQQIYVSSNAWNAVKNLKEQNMLSVNQLAQTLPPDATALDLNKLLLSYLMNDSNANLQDAVSEVLSYEAKKIL